MKKIYTLLCIAATMLAACAKENLVENDATPQDEEVKYIDVTFGAEFPVPAELQDNAKTMLNSDRSVSWCEGDKIAVNTNGTVGAKTNLYLATFNSTISKEDPYRATFTGTINDNATKFVAIYPAINVKCGDIGLISDGCMYGILPASQAATEGSFTNGCAISYATGTAKSGQIKETSLTFTNLCSVLEFTMPNYVLGAQQVTIKSNNGTKISGGYCLDRHDFVFKSFKASSEKDATYDYVTVTAPNTASKFYAVIFPGNYASGFNITVTTADGQTYSRNVTKALDAQANHIYDLGVLGVVLDEGKVSPTVSIEQNLSTGSIATLNMTVSDVFKDMVTKWIVELCDKNGVVIRKSEITDGNLSNIKMDVIEGHTLIPAGDYTIKVSYNMPTGSTRKISTDFSATAPQFNVTVTDLEAESNLAYSGGVLTGTDIKVTSFTVDVLPEIAAKIEWVNFNLKDANGTLYRTSTKLNEVMAVQNSLPYLPNGTYKLTAGFLLTELGGTDIAETAAFDVTVSHTPTFGVSLISAKTSYDYYKADDINKANGCNNMGIYELAANLTDLSISSEVTTQMVLAEKFYYEWFIGDTSIGKTDGNGSVSGISMNTDGATPVDFGNKNVICKLTFDNIVKDSGNIAVNITGLPWKETPPTNKDNWNFSGNYSTTNESFLELGGSHGTGKPTATFKKSLYIPSNIDTKVRAYIHTRTAHAGVWYTTTFEFNLAGSKIIEYGSGKVEKDQDRGYIEGNGTLKTSDNSISMNGTYGMRMENTYIRVYDLQILYR